MLAPTEDTETLTLKEYLEEQRQLELDAAEALPFKFDQCAWDMGPTRQNLFICTNCPETRGSSEPRAFCYACAVTCHGDDGHGIEEIWSRRNFLCDCPQTGRCRFIPKLKKLSDHIMHQNSYHSRHNFFGFYCYCECRGWGETEETSRTMYQCEVCEDWFHDVCVSQKSHGVGNQIPAEDSFQDFICVGCVSSAYSLVFSRLSPSACISNYPQSQTLHEHRPLFLAGNWRNAMASCFQSAKDHELLASLKMIHLIQPPELVYAPDEDKEAQSSLYELGLKALNEHAPRDKAALGIKMIDLVKEKLKTHFEAIAADGRIITPEDVHEFFATHCSKRP